MVAGRSAAQVCIGDARNCGQLRCQAETVKGFGVSQWAVPTVRSASRCLVAVFLVAAKKSCGTGVRLQAGVGSLAGYIFKKQRAGTAIMLAIPARM